ncbi:MAG: hypothetical protein GDA47_01785 [Rhodospirillales bacterium]|nr:hypothetical protein [Rhodospirillales bacterium]
MIWIAIAVPALAAELLLAFLLFAAARKRRRLAAALKAAAAAEVAAPLPALLRQLVSQGGVPHNVVPQGGAGTGGGIVRLTQRCALRFSPGGAWHDMEAQTLVAVAAPGFVQQAKIKAGPLAVLRTADAFVAGRGSLEARLFGLVPIARAEGAAADRSEAIRYLAELLRAPDALAQVPGLSWQELDAASVRVRVATASGSAEALLRLAEDGSVVLRAERPRASGDGAVPTPWEARLRNLQPIGGRQIFTESELCWLLPGGAFPYWRGCIAAYRLEG